jgi:hypothetical protein
MSQICQTPKLTPPNLKLYSSAECLQVLAGDEESPAGDVYSWAIVGYALFYPNMVINPNVGMHAQKIVPAALTFPGHRIIYLQACWSGPD